MTKTFFSRALAMTRFVLKAGATRLRAPVKRMETLGVDTPAALANVLVNDFEAALFAIPKAVHGRSIADGAEFLRSAHHVLAELGGYESRRSLLKFFTMILDTPGLRSMAAFCAFIQLPTNAELRRTLAWGGLGSAALGAITVFHSLAASRRLPKMPTRPGNPTVQPFGPEEAAIAREWASLNSLLSEKGWRGDEKKWARVKRRGLQRLDYLAFLRDAVSELLDMIFAAPENRSTKATRPRV